MPRLRPLFSVLVMAIVACHETATAPPATRVVPVVSRLLAYSSVLVTAVPGSATIAEPAVVVLDQAGAPLSGVAVTFTVVDGSGSVSRTQAASDAKGVASSGAWMLGSTGGQNTLRASVTASSPIAPVFFTAIGLVLPADSSTYNLTTMGVTPLPVTQCCNYYGVWYTRQVEDTVSYTTIGGRFVFTSDSTFTWLHLVAVPDSTGVFHVDSTTSLTHGQTIRVGPSVVHFYTDGDLFATGTTNGNVLSVSLEDAWPGYYNETYVGSQPRQNTSRSPARGGSVGRPQ